VRIGASVGVALSPDHAQDASTLLRNADTAMYHAKESGKNNFRVFSPEMEHHSIQRFTMEQGLRHAIEAGQLELLYQPQVTLNGKQRLVGFEALLRWNHPELGVIGPQEFIPLAEETGLIHAIGDWVMRTGFRQASAWQSVLPGVRIGINLSVRQLRQGDIVDRILAELAASALPPDLLDLELTETMLMDERAAAGDKLRALREAGIKVALDDFGTGYSSLSYLKLYPVDVIKIDRSFVSALPGDEGDASITRAIISIAKAMGLALVAEGVETPSHAQFLREAGCPMAQGYLFSRPLSAKAATEWVFAESHAGKPEAALLP
jgi:EAL domain-containing protein (putative c-di-GMP-specific phosphodiesterase class I)